MLHSFSFTLLDSDTCLSLPFFFFFEVPSSRQRAAHGGFRVRGLIGPDPPRAAEAEQRTQHRGAEDHGERAMLMLHRSPSPYNLG